MEISPQVSDIISVLSVYARGELRDAGMLSHFLQHAANSGRHEALGDLSFAAKYLTRVQGAIRKQTPDSELYAKLQEEFSYGVHNFHAKLGEFVAEGDEDFQTMVARHYLAVSQEALRHLIELAVDFTWLKNWELEMTQDSAD